MKLTEPLALHHSWALFDRERRFDLGWVGEGDGVVSMCDAFPRVGRWECDLRDNALTWSAEVYDLFGLPRGARLSRDETVALYCEDSRAAMERLRAYAIKHRRGFTLDAEIRPAQGGPRWMRLMAAPVCEGSRVVRLQGFKRDVSELYGLAGV